MVLRGLVMMMLSTVSRRNFFQDSPDTTKMGLQVKSPGQAIIPDLLLLPEVVLPPGLLKGTEETIMM
jgi:hypothetical protein